jgi:hypothetical protein
MLYSPRRTIHQIVKTNPKQYLTLVASLGGIYTLLNQLSSSEAGDHLILPLILIIAFIGGPLLGIVQNNLLGRLLHWVGSRLDGKGSVDSVRAAYAWSFIPSIWVLVLWLPAIAIFKLQLFSRSIPSFETDALLSLGYIAFFFVELIAGTWSLILFVANISEVEKLPILRSVAAIFLGLLIIIVVLFALGALVQGLRF